MALIEVSDADFEEKVLQSEVPVLVDFWAPWCGPCHMMAPILEEFAGDFEGRVVVGKLNVDENREYANQYGITGIPTMILFAGGEPVEKIVGVTQKNDLAGQISKHLKE